jgi:Ca2+/Na+ antiporter
MSTTKTFLHMNAWDILRENGLQIIMYILGAIMVGWISGWLAVVYLAYSILSNVLYMAWVCPYCGHYSLGTCPAGFHILSGRRFKARLGRTYGSQFRRNVYVMAPGRFLPPIAGLYLLLTRFSWSVLILLVAFCVVGFWWLPESSKKHCEGCETLDCPRHPKTVKRPG